MPAVVATNFGALGTITVTETTLNGTDSLPTYVAGLHKYLILRNPTGSAVSPVIDGDGGTTEFLPGVGNVSVTSGYAVGAIPAGASRAINLENIRAYLRGNIAINSGTGLVAVLVT